MGSALQCGIQRRPKKSSTHKLVAQKYLGKFEQFELDMLTLIFKDLASRQSNSLLSRDTFNTFFQIIGFWGEQIFNKFTNKQEDYMNFDEFLAGMEMYIKCSDEQRIVNLFQLYDLQNQKGIAKSDFLQMMQNYPQYELKKICEDQLFLDESLIIDDFGNRRKHRHRKYKNSADLLELSVQPFRKQSQNISEQQFDSSNKIISEGQQSCFSKQSDALFVQDSMIQENGTTQKRFGLLITAQVDGQKIEMCVNQSVLIKKYVDLVYKNKHDQLLSLQEFQAFIAKHPNLIQPLYAAFNYNIWGITDKQPNYKQLMLIMSGDLYRISKKKEVKQKHCELYPHVLLEYSKKGEGPSKVICLQGLIIEEKVHQQVQKYGFEVMHVGKQYKVKSYECSDDKQFRLWQNALQAYNNGEISKKYSILEKIGQGQSSMVYKCQDKQTKETYALKIINKQQISQNQADAIKHEVEIMKLINHPYIVRLVESFENKSHIYLVTELIKDGDLYDYVEEKKYLAEEEAALVLSQLIDALESIQQMGIVHRDIKPENIMIVLNQNTIKQVKIIDFGFANYLSILNERKENFECGTMNYIAPEVYQQCKELTSKIDNFALGGVLYFMLCGYAPFYSEIVLEIKENIIDGNYDIQDEFWQCVNDDVKELIAGLFEVDPLKRFSLQQVKEHIWMKKFLEKRKSKKK
ncbi:unnamed protein product [Paramecium octaurelia]|uniref:non-specific serine/threonine protein kinase n=1 Tax=Paramecium octaurelia TaxID=43137 RepID=A0A8S1YIU9_PAROT|nr:unnamed protein product [Paramecium octaurelia]